MNLNELIRIRLKLTLNHFAGIKANLDGYQVCDGELKLIRLLSSQHPGITVSHEVSNSFERLLAGLEIDLMFKD
jgi:hypothetical protein